jgi:hypothetical protein
MRAQADLARQFVTNAPNSFYVPLYGPQVSLFFAPFAELPYGYAIAAWLAVNVLIYAFCCFAVWETCPGLQAYRWTVLILAIGFPGFFHLLAWGQTSGIALLCFTLAYLALQQDRKILAGLAIGSLIFKPQLGLAGAVVFVCAREVRIIAGALAAASVQLAVAWMHYGTEVMRSYWRALIHVQDVLPLLEPRLYQTHSLRSHDGTASIADMCAGADRYHAIPRRGIERAVGVPVVAVVREGVLPGALGSTHHAYRSPHIASFVQSILAAVW